MFGYCEHARVRLETIDVNGDPHWTDVAIEFRSRLYVNEVEVWHEYKGVVFVGSAIKAEKVYNDLIEEETACYEEIAKYMQDERGLKSTVSVYKR